MSVSVTQTVGMSIAEIPSSNTTLVTNAAGAITFDGLQKTQTLNSASTPAVTKQSSYRVTMSTGAATIDLTSMAGGVNGATVTFSGLKVCGYLFGNPVANANNITIVGGASNGYLIFGASGSVVLSPGEKIELYVDAVASTKATVDGTHKTIDISGTASQFLDVQLIAG